jgi:hypothetical protein
MHRGETGQRGFGSRQVVENGRFAALVPIAHAAQARRRAKCLEVTR